jgi:hypothetical protein
VVDRAFVERIVAAIRADGGANACVVGERLLPPEDAWSFPRYPERTRIIAPGADLVAELAAFIAANDAQLRAAGCYLGAWINPQTREVYLDIATSRAELGEALALARMLGAQGGRAVVAIYNPARRETVYL